MIDVPGLSAFRRRASTLISRLQQAMKTEVYAFWRRRPIRQDTVLYESFNGNGVLCNPEAIFRGLLDDPQFASFTHVWVLASAHQNPNIRREFARSRSVRFVRPGSVGYYRALATARYLINNATFPPEFGKRQDQLYLNTWHGTPLKRMGYDIGDVATRVANEIRNMLSADFLLSASPFMTEHLYEKAHLLGQIYRGRVIEEGYPRIDRQFLDEPTVAAARAALELDGVRLEGRQIILYAPTWKGTSFSRPKDDIRELVSRIERLEAQIDSTKYVVLLKTHQVVHRFTSDVPGLKSRLVPNETPSNVILGITDVLVTDYSSIFFDFLASGRPIFFLTPDLADYAGYRGLYIEPAEWPGTVVETVEGLAAAVNEFDRSGVTGRVAENYHAMQDRFVAKEDGSAAQRIIDIVFRGNTEGYSVEPISHDLRRTVLIYAGGMRPNEITSELVALLENIDHGRFDVSVIFPSTRVRSVRDQQRLLDPRVRQFARVGGMNGSKLAVAALRSTSMGARSTRRSAREARLWHDEWRRCFGSSTFDFTLDFAGTSSFWARLMLESPNSERSIWMRDDRVTLAEEREKIDVLRDSYDHIVSIVPAVDAPSKTRFVTTSLSGRDRIVEDSLMPIDVNQKGSRIPDWVIGDNPPDADADAVFAALGRLSIENNPLLLIRAFARVYSAAPQSRLIVIGGGPLAAAVAAEVDSLGLSDRVWLAGYRSNPFAILRRAHCFVFTGQARDPRVVKEASVLGLPIVATTGGGQAERSGVLNVAAEAWAVAEAMLASIHGTRADCPIDWVARDEAALIEFSLAVGLVTQ